MSYSLQEDESGRYLRIMDGRKWIGRVCQHADGSWIGIVGKYIMVRGCHSAKGAFNEAIAQHLRYDLPVKSKKKKIHARSAQKAVVRTIANRQTVVRTEISTEIFSARTAQMRDFSLQEKANALE